MSRPPNEKDNLLPTKDTRSEEVKKIEDEEDDKDDGGSILLIAFGLMIVTSLGNRIFGKLSTYPMHNYPMFTNLLCTFVYVPLSFVYIIPAQLFSNNITKEQTDVPKFSFFVMGAMDSVSSTMSSLAINYITSASITVLVQQSAIPISMGLSAMFLGARYTYPQYTGAAIVLGGIVAVLLPTFFSNSSSLPPDQLIWVLCIIISNVPSVYSSVYKEKALGEVDIDVVYLNGWVAIFQCMMAIPLCIPSAMAIGMPMADIPANLVGGLNCLFGINTILESSADGSIRADECSMAMSYVPWSLLCNVGYNLLMIIILKHGSANILWMASTVIVPLSNVAFSLHFIPNHQPMKPMDIVGLVIIMSGLVVFRFTAQIVSLYEDYFGKSLSPEEIALRKKAKRIKKMAQKKQIRMVGLNQIEYLNALVDSRVMRAQRIHLFRSPAQARGDLLSKLGIPPSPNFSAVSGKTTPSYEFSPRFAISPRAQQRRAAQLVAEERGDFDKAAPRRPNEV